jgi:4-phospho-D-threonate 3-dehydrogenase / 4-phospho-D-erythronate 3-dehydrogenase
MGVDIPVVAITMGDPAGVGPEVTVRAVADPATADICRPLVVGDAGRLRDAASRCGLELEVQPVAEVAAADFTTGALQCLDLGLVPDDLPYGEVSEIGGEVAFQCVRVAAELAMAGQVQAICTAPLNKLALHRAGHPFPGHTEMLASLTGTPEVSMMLTAPNLRVVHVTTHVGLLDMIALVEPGLVARTIARGHQALVTAGIERPRIAVCGLNPHAGENGLFGHHEEEEKIAPGVARAQADGIDVVGPLPADTLFFRAARGDFDLVVAIYHDQGHGPIKVQGLEDGVNITLGLPVVRTSVDHGTAFDIAGTGVADERSMVEALRQAVNLATAPPAS